MLEKPARRGGMKKWLISIIIFFSTMAGFAETQSHYVGYDLDVEPDGSAYVVGVEVIDAGGGALSTNGWLAKYNSSQVLVDSVTYPGAAFYSIRRGPSGNLFVAGKADHLIGLESGSEMIIAKFSPALAFINKTLVGNSFTGLYNDQANALAVDPTGKIVALGTVQTGNGKSQVWIARLDEDLHILKASGYSRPDAPYAYGKTLAIDKNGNFYVAAGCSQNSSDSSTPAVSDMVIKFDRNLNFVLSQEIHVGQPTAHFEPTGIAINGAGEIFVSGEKRVLNSPIPSSIWLCQLSKETAYGFDQIKHISWDPSPLDDTPFSLAANLNGDLFVSGEINSEAGGATQTSGWVGRFSSSLIFKSSFTFSGDGSQGENVTTGIKIFNNSLYGTGASTNAGGTDPVLIKKALGSDLSPVMNTVEVTAVSTQSLSVRWSDPAGASRYRVRASLENNNEAFIKETSVTEQQGTLSDLSANTIYYGFVSRCEGPVCSVDVPFGPVATAARPPIDLKIVSQYQMFLELSFNRNGNPSGTTYVLEADTGDGSGFKTLYSIVSGNEEIVVTSPNVTPDKNYKFRVRAKNLDGVASDPSDALDVSTVEKLTRRYYGQDIEPDPSGASVVGGVEVVLSSLGTKSRNGWLAKYNGSQVLESSVSIQGVWFNGMVRDNDGTLYAVGGREKGLYSDLFIAKYSPSLVLVASQTISGGPYTTQEANRIAVASNGDLIVLGRLSDGRFHSVGWIGRMGSDLQVKQATFFRDSDAEHQLNDLCLDGEGNIFVSGIMGSGHQQVGFVDQYSPDLAFRLGTRFRSSGQLNGSQYGSSRIDLNPDGNPSSLSISITKI